MAEIRCPKCKEVFQVDETGYEQIVQQVRDNEFAKELERRNKELETIQAQNIELISMQKEKEYTENINKKNSELLAKDQEIAALRAKLDAGEMEQAFAVSKAMESKAQEFLEETKDSNLIGACVLTLFFAVFVMNTFFPIKLGLTRDPMSKTYGIHKIV